MSQDRPADAVREAWRHFLGAHARVLSGIDADLLAHADMSFPEYEVLAHLAEQPDHRMRMNELAARARLSPSGLTRRFDSLVRRGWVARERCNEDRRGVLARLTPLGAEAAVRARPVHDRGVQAYFGDVLGAEAVEALAETMRLLDHSEADSVGPGRPAEAPDRNEGSEPAVPVGDR